jgi:hypothetical protein
MSGAMSASSRATAGGRPDELAFFQMSSTLPTSSLDGRPLLGVVQPEELLSLSDVIAHADVNLGDAPDCLGNDRDGPEEKRRSFGRRMIVEHHRDQADGEHQAGGNAPSQLVPDRVERDFLAEPLALNIAAVEISGKTVKSEQRSSSSIDQLPSRTGTSLLFPAPRQRVAGRQSSGAQ